MFKTDLKCAVADHTLHSTAIDEDLHMVDDDVDPLVDLGYGGEHSVRGEERDTHYLPLRVGPHEYATLIHQWLMA